jgi:hypothetical protein
MLEHYVQFMTTHDDDRQGKILETLRRLDPHNTYSKCPGVHSPSGVVKCRIRGLSTLGDPAKGTLHMQKIRNRLILIGGSEIKHCRVNDWEVAGSFVEWSAPE